MRDYSNKLFNAILKRVEDPKESVIRSEILNKDFVSLQYFLTRNFYYAIIVDDYLFEITDKSSLLEALYYQVRLITVHDLNWDAMQEGLNDIFGNFLEFEGVCLLFKQGTSLADTLQNEFKTLTEIIQENNRQDDQKKSR